MDKKYIERPKEFDRKEYTKNYCKTHYKDFSTKIQPELRQRIDCYCYTAGITKAEFLRRAIDKLEENEDVC